MDNNLIDFYCLGAMHANDDYDEIKDLEEIIENNYGKEALEDFAFGLASSVETFNNVETISESNVSLKQGIINAKRYPKSKKSTYVMTPIEEEIGSLVETEIERKNRLSLVKNK